MNPEEEKEFADYLLECFKRGVEGREMPAPLFGGREIVEPRVAARCLLRLLPHVPAKTASKSMIKALLKS